MLKLNKEVFEQFDWVLLTLAVLLGVIGIFCIYSATFDPTSGAVKSFYVKQAWWFGLGLVSFFGFSAISYKKVVKYGIVMYFAGLLVLLVVLVLGSVGMGARRWIDLGPVSLQPSEFMKLVWVVMIARLMSDMSTQKLGFVALVRKGVWVVPPFLLVFFQPDLGTALTYLAIWGFIMLVIGIRTLTMIVIVVSLAFAVPMMWGQLKDYQQQRIITFMNPEADPFGSGYHVIQSKIAVGSGGLIGKGFLDGTQSHLKFIPERHTDFIFSVITEEWGFVGGTLIVTLFLLLVFRLFMIANIVKEPTGKIICIGVAGFIFLQFFLNSAMTMGLTPVVGIPMPFVSYGGSSIMTFMMMLGIANSIHIKRYDAPGVE